MRLKTVLMLCVCAFTLNVRAQEVQKSLAQNLEISIYNNDLALVKDFRRVNFEEGVNQVSLEGVASKIKPTSVIILGDDIHVIEQNYDYALLTPYNIVEKSVGQVVQTVRTNPTTGSQIFDKARLISFQGGVPVLQFDYGIETEFDGRLVFDQLPAGLSQKPILAAKISSVQAGLKNILLAYLTNGISWNTNYVASVKDENTLDLAGWVSINNQSGVSYENAKVQLIAGDVNEVQTPSLVRGAVMMKSADFAADSLNSMGEAMPEQESFSSYQLYTLPNRTTILDKQTKQLALIEQNKVKYHKEGRVYSRLYLSGDYKAEFEKVHPLVYYVIKNDEDSNLGVPLPQGVFRFYENDSKGNMQFIGENSIGHVAKGEKMELAIGKMFDVFVDGKVDNIRKVSEEIIKDAVTGRCPRYKIVRAYDVVVDFHNGGPKAAEIVFKQGLRPNTKIVQENIAGQISEKNSSEYEWQISLSGDEDKTLTFTAEQTVEETQCH